MTEKLASLQETEDEYVEEIGDDQLRAALSAIAQEVQKYQHEFHSCKTSQTNLNDTDQDGSNDESDELDLYKTKLKEQRKIIKTLKDHLKTACMIAKTALAAKENDIVSYNNKISVARNESACLLKKTTESMEVAQRLTAENEMLSDKLINIRNFIELGYQELVKMRNEREETELPVLMQLKKIMVCCGQYYADYNNEREKYLQLEQKNRYLTNKLNILENSLDAVTDELRKFKCQNFVNNKKGSKEKNANEYRRTQTVGFVCRRRSNSEYQLGISSQVARTTTTVTTSHNSEPDNEADVCRNSAHELDLTSHLSLVKSLLSDQDSMLQDLRNITNELGTLS